MPDAPLPAPPSLPPQLGPYRIIRRLGEGGMGTVFLAFDAELGRRVALKWLKHASPALADRLRQEAQLHARVEHPNVCRLYQVGEHEGFPYLVMQFIHGKTLDQVGPALSLEGKLRLMAEVADGVQAAHRQGLIHRDLKPANLMVEADEAGRWRPYVMDFGLARDEAAGSLTAAGTLLGSPSYMSPEQVRGGWLDSRTDVYGLGASLFELLTGRPPFEGDRIVELLHKVQQEDPPTLRTFLPEAPRDLQTILDRSLAKDPAARYASAAAFRDDLQRVLDGEPIHARRESILEWSLRWIRRHPRQAAGIALAGAGFLLFGGLWIRAERGSSERARFSREFGAELAAVEQMGRLAALLPPHDTRREMQQIRERLARIRVAMDCAGAQGLGPGHYALGRGHLTLGEDEEARRHLERAWAVGNRDPDTAAALGRALGRLYQQKLAELRRIQGKELQEVRRRTLEIQYRDPCLAFLKQAVGARSDSRGIVEGLIALYEKHHDRALAFARKAVDEEPMAFEGWRLEAEVLHDRAAGQADRGDWEGAKASLAQAGEAILRGQEIARSDAGLREAECSRRLLGLEIDHFQGRFKEEGFRGVQDACDTALQVDPESAIALERKAMAYCRKAEYQLKHNEDPRPALARAREFAAAARGHHPRRAAPHALEGFTWWRAMEFERLRGLDPRSSAERGIAAYGRALELDPADAATIGELGILEQTVAEEAFRHGKDPRATLARAREHLERSLALDGRNASVHNNLAMVHHTTAMYESTHNLAPEASFRDALRAYQASLAINPNKAAVHSNLGGTCAEFADYLRRTGKPWEATLDQALAAHRRSLDLDPSNPTAMYNLAFALQTKADEKLRREGANPTALVAEARAAIGKAIRIQPKESYLRLVSALISLVEAKWAIRQARPAEPSFRRAEADLRLGEQANPKDEMIANGFGELWLQRSTIKGIPESARRACLHKTLASVDRALAINPEALYAQVLQGKAFTRLAEDAKGPERRRLAEDAVNAFEKLLRQDPTILGEFEQEFERAKTLRSGSPSATR